MIPGGGSGKNAIRRLLDIDQNVKSGYSTDTFTDHYEEFNFSGVTMKPYQVTELNEVRRAVMNRQTASRLTQPAVSNHSLLK